MVGNVGIWLQMHNTLVTPENCPNPRGRNEPISMDMISYQVALHMSSFKVRPVEELSIIQVDS
jgi:hypothetical protein